MDILSNINSRLNSKCIGPRLWNLSKATTVIVNVYWALSHAFILQPTTPWRHYHHAFTLKKAEVQDTYLARRELLNSRALLAITWPNSRNATLNHDPRWGKTFQNCSYPNEAMAGVPRFGTQRPHLDFQLCHLLVTDPFVQPQFSYLVGEKTIYPNGSQKLTKNQ